jgi:hypothetical protein
MGIILEGKIEAPHVFDKAYILVSNVNSIGGIIGLLRRYGNGKKIENMSNEKAEPNMGTENDTKEKIPLPAGVAMFHPV